MSDRTAFEVGRLYQPIKAMADALSASQKDVFVRLPGLRGYYPTGIRNSSGHAIDHSNAGANLLQQGTCPVGYDGNSFAHLGDGTNYLYGAGLNAITGLEAWISSSMRGLTLGGWFMVDSTPAIDGGLISKEGIAGNAGYALVWRTSEAPTFTVSGTGSDAFTATGPVSTQAQWHFLVGRFTPSAEVAVFQDGNKSTFTASVPASLNVSSQSFEIGRRSNNNASIVHGKARDVFVCAAALSDALIEETRVTSVP